MRKMQHSARSVCWRVNLSAYFSVYVLNLSFATSGQAFQGRTCVIHWQKMKHRDYWIRAVVSGAWVCHRCVIFVFSHWMDGLRRTKATSIRLQRHIATFCVKAIIISRWPFLSIWKYGQIRFFSQHSQNNYRPNFVFVFYLLPCILFTCLLSAPNYKL